MSLPQSLISALSSKSILPLVGAGVSMSIKTKDGASAFPSWKELLLNGASKLKDEDELDKATLVETFLSMNNYQEAARYAYEGLKNGLWHDFITEQFTIDVDSLDGTSVELPRAIWRLSNQIITLNYDRILSWAHPADSVQISELTNDAVANLPRMFNESETPTVWHLHGHIDDTARLILTPDSYSKLYPTSEQTNTEYQAALQTLKTVVATRNLIFIGCSLEDAELLAEINKQNELFIGASKRHFVLIKESNKSVIQEKLKNTNINIITFDDYGRPLVDKINEMAKYINTHDVIDEMSNVKNEQISESKTEPKVAYLSANPIGEDIDYQPILKELKKLPFAVHCFPLTENNLQNLSGYEYVFIASKVVKDRLVIEDDDACFGKIDFIDLQNNADLDDKSCVFIFTDKTVDNTKIDGIKFPLIIHPFVENDVFKKELSSITFQFFKKRNVEYYKNSSLIINNEKIKFPIVKSIPLSSANRIIKNETPLPRSIDKCVLKHFIGRNEDLMFLSREVTKLEGDNGFITIKGSGGLGKTTISKMLAIKLSERGRFKGGIEFIDCEHLLNYDQFKFRLASAFNLEQANNIEEYLSNDSTYESKLIILDNFETLLHLKDKNEILSLLSFMSDFASIIVTSRELLKIDGEIAYALRQMTLDEAFELFISRLGKRKLSSKEEQLVRYDIVDQLLDKNPLAIIIITSNILPSKDLFSLHAELKNDFFNISEEDLSLFDNATDIHIDRKKSLYGSILYSYNMLLDNEKEAFEKLALFPDGIDVENFKKLSQQSKDKNINKSVISDSILKKLQNKSLVKIVKMELNYNLL